MSNEVRFVVPGRPQGKGRPRFDSRSKRAYTPKNTADYEKLILLCYREQSNVIFKEGIPLEMEIDAKFPIPKGTSKKKTKELIGTPYTKKADADNLAKVIMDGINGVAFHDDAQITSLKVTKTHDVLGSVRVIVREVEDEELSDD